MKAINYIVTLFDANPEHSKITIALTMAVNAARKGHRSAVILMGDAVELANPGSLEEIAIGAPFATGKDLLKELLDKNGQILVCESCLLFKGLSAEDIDTRFPIITGGDVIDLSIQAKGSIQVS